MMENSRLLKTNNEWLMRAKVFVSGCGMVDDLVASVVQERQLNFLVP